jgi:hypothetical protein
VVARYSIHASLCQCCTAKDIATTNNNSYFYTLILNRFNNANNFIKSGWINGVFKAG